MQLSNTVFLIVVIKCRLVYIIYRPMIYIYINNIYMTCTDLMYYRFVDRFRKNNELVKNGGLVIFPGDW